MGWFSVSGKEETRLTDKEKIASVLVGLVSGVIGHKIISSHKKRIIQALETEETGQHVAQIGSMLMFLAVFCPEQYKYALGGLGAGITIEDMVEQSITALKKKKLAVMDTGGVDILSKYSKLIHIDPSLPQTEKERLILPIFPRVVREMRNVPAQRNAIARYKMELFLRKDKLRVSDTFFMQQWTLFNGIYEKAEGMWFGHDRFRTLAKLFTVRDSGKHKKDGRNAFRYDCDCHSISLNQVVDSYAYPPYFVLISQRKPLLSNKPQLHHVLPAVMSGGRLWLVEGIKLLPIVPIEYIGEIFKDLQRVVVVSDGGIKEYTAWRYQRLRRVR